MLRTLFAVSVLLIDAIILSASTKNEETSSSAPSANILREVVVKYKKKPVLHILAFVRDYSTLSTYDDTITLYREKWVDFMLPVSRNCKYEGWKAPRVLKAKSYYRFTNACGLDSVSNACNQHFSWSDWVGIIDNMEVPTSLLSDECSQDTIFGQYGASEIWSRHGDYLCLNVDVLADSSAHKWVPDFSHFLRGMTDFERFKIRYDFGNFYNKLYALDLTAISCDIESRGRARDMFQFNRRDEPFFVTTHTDFYIADKEFLTVSQAKKWREKNVSDDYWPSTRNLDNVPALSAQTAELIARVERIDHDAIRLGWTPAPQFVPHTRHIVPLHKRYFKFLKSLIGL